MQEEKYNKKRGKIGWLFPAVGVPIFYRDRQQRKRGKPWFKN